MVENSSQKSKNIPEVKGIKIINKTSSKFDSFIIYWALNTQSGHVPETGNTTGCGHAVEHFPECEALGSLPGGKACEVMKLTQHEQAEDSHMEQLLLIQE